MQIGALIVAVLFTCLAGPASLASEAPSGGAARIVAWKPNAPARNFELGYQRHLEWHRAKNDPWTWHGWTIVSGERAGYFVDGTFFHAWTDFDAPVAPAEDAADNRLNVYPYAELQSVGAYEAVGSKTTFPLTAPLLTFIRLEIAPGQARTFEAAIAKAGQRGREAVPYLLLRPVDGTTEYLLLLAAERQSDLPTLAAFTEDLLGSVASSSRERPIVQRVTKETARYRADMSYVPGKN